MKICLELADIQDALYVISFDFMMCISWILLLPPINQRGNDYDKSGIRNLSAVHCSVL